MLTLASRTVNIPAVRADAGKARERDQTDCLRRAPRNRQVVDRARSGQRVGRGLVADRLDRTGDPGIRPRARVGGGRGLPRGVCGGGGQSAPRPRCHRRLGERLDADAKRLAGRRPPRRRQSRRGRDPMYRPRRASSPGRSPGERSTGPDPPRLAGRDRARLSFLGIAIT